MTRSKPMEMQPRAGVALPRLHTPPNAASGTACTSKLCRSMCAAEGRIATASIRKHTQCGLGRLTGLALPAATNPDGIDCMMKGIK
ncbi:MAG: hypothetical protein ACPIOQ_30555 [Promethearchaeia archaeon]